MQNKPKNEKVLEVKFKRSHKSNQKNSRQIFLFIHAHRHKQTEMHKKDELTEK